MAANLAHIPPLTTLPGIDNRARHVCTVQLLSACDFDAVLRRFATRLFLVSQIEMRSSCRLLFSRGFGRPSDDKLAFTDLCMGLKNRFRGKGQSKQAQEVAGEFITKNIPADINSGTFMNFKNACAALSVLSFFELDHPAKADLGAWISSRIASMSPEEKVEAGTALLQADLVKYKDAVRGSVVAPLSTNCDNLSMGQLSLLVKIMQRCGGEIPTDLWKPVAATVYRNIQQCHGTSDVTRFFSGFARSIPSEGVTVGMFRYLLEHIEELKPYDYSTFLASSARMHQTNPLKLEDVRILASRAAEHGTALNCRDLGTVLSNIMRIRASYKPTTENVQSLWAVDDAIQIVLQSLKNLPLKFMDSHDEQAWSSETDIVALIFAFESSGGKFDEIFDAFNTFVRNRVKTIEGRNLALSLGILRRTKHLDDELAKALSDRVAEVMDDFIITELSHVVFTYRAVRGEHPSWIDRARMIISSLVKPTTPSHALLNIRVSFPGESALVANVNLDEISFRQMVDVLRAPNVDAELREEVLKAARVQLEKIVAPSNAEVEALVEIGKSDFCGLGSLAKDAAERVLGMPYWPLDVVALTSLCNDEGKLSLYAEKALETATKACTSCHRFIAYAGTLLQYFPKNEDIREWVVNGTERLIGVDVPIQAYLPLFDVLNKSGVDMSAQWYTGFVTGPLSEAVRYGIGPKSMAKFIKQIGKAPNKYEFTEPVNIMIDIATEKAKGPKEAAQVYAAAAMLKLEGIKLPSDTARGVLELQGELTEEERTAVEQCRKRAPTPSFAERQQERMERRPPPPRREPPRIPRHGPAADAARAAQSMIASMEAVRPGVEIVLDKQPTLILNDKGEIGVVVEEGTAEFDMAQAVAEAMAKAEALAAKKKADRAAKKAAAAKKLTGKAAAKKVTKTAAKKVSKPVAKKVTKPAAKKVSKPVAKKVAKPAAKKVSKPAVKKVGAKKK